MSDKRITIELNVGSQSVKLSRLVSPKRAYSIFEDPSKEEVSKGVRALCEDAIDAILKGEK